MSYMSKRLDVRAATSSLKEAVDERGRLTSGEVSSVVESFDIKVCVGVRRAFTAYVDSIDQEPAAVRERLVIELRTEFERAVRCLQSSDYSDADSFRNSVQEKLDLLDGLESGKTIDELLPIDDLLPPSPAPEAEQQI